MHNILKVTFREIKKYWFFNLLRFLGLTFGLASIFIILLYIINETSYNKFNNKIDDIIFVSTYSETYKIEKSFTPHFLGKEIKNEIPQIIDGTSIRFCGRISVEKDGVWSPNTSTVMSSDNSFFNIFTIKFIAGEPKTALLNSNSIILTESEAKKYFDQDNPLGQSLKVKILGYEYELLITGVIEDFPRLSSFKTGFLIPPDLGDRAWTKLRPNDRFNFDQYISSTFLLKNSKISMDDLSNNLKRISKKYSTSKHKFEFSPIKLSDLHFQSKNFNVNIFPYGNKTSVFTFLCIVIVITILTCANYIVLSLAISTQNIKKYCTMKILGANKKEIILLEFSKTIILTLFTIPFAFLLAKFILPIFSQYFGVQIDLLWILNYQFLSKIIIIVFLMSIISSLLISIYISTYDYKLFFRSMSNNVKTNGKMMGLLVIVQIFIMFVLITSSIIINKQTKLLFNKKLGFNQNDLIILPISKRQSAKYEVIKNGLLNHSFIESVTAIDKILLKDKIQIISIAMNESPNDKRIVNTLKVGDNFFETMDMELIKGNRFNNSYSENNWSIIVNEEFVKQFGLTDPIGKTLTDNATIIGVVKDFHIKGIRKNIGPCSISQSDKLLRNIIIRIKPGLTLQSLDIIKKEWENVYPNTVFRYNVYDDIIKNTYIADFNFHNLITIFTFISIFISCIGLYGISLFVAKSRTREVCIRRIVGANNWSLSSLLSKDIIKQMLVSFFLAVPVIIFFMNKWLNGFAYKIKIDILDFLIASIFATVIMLFTVLVSTRKVVRSNPVDILRSE